MEVTLQNLFSGFATALTPGNLFYALTGCLIGTLVGVLPGVGPLAGISMLLPTTFGLNATSAIILLAGIYYGAMYGGSTTSILMKIPGEAASVMTCIDGHAMALRGRAGPALAIAAMIGPNLARRLGPFIEHDSRFPNRTNVQFMEVLDRHNIKIEIWERGAGYTLASGSSSCAAATVAYRLALCDSKITVHMPGGNIDIALGADYSVRMTGPVAKVFEGTISKEMFS